jgi:sugar phosphate isomerase/epimerase
MARVPISLQLYSVRDDCAADLAATVKAVAAMGYEGVEFAGYYNWSAADLRALLDDCGLVCSGTHIGLDALLGDAFEATVEFHTTIGCANLIVPGLADQYRDSAAAWKSTGELFTRLAAQLKPYALRTGYHNHSIEFSPLNGSTGWDIFFSNSSDDVVMQLDTGNAMHGGADPVPYVSRYPGRAITVHLKEFSSTNPDALIGEGECRWDEIFHLCESVGGTQWYVVEQETYAYPPLECVERCLANLKGMGK